MTETEILYVPDLAKKLGKTEAAIRSAIQDKSEAIPPHFKLGRRVAWRASTVSRWLDKKDARGRKI